MSTSIQKGNNITMPQFKGSVNLVATLVKLKEVDYRSAYEILS